MLPRAVAVALVCLAFGSLPAQQTPPPAQTAYTEESGSLSVRIATLLNEPAIAGAHWGIAVTTLEGAPVYALDAEKLFRPASTAKLFTTAAALALLGPEATVTTTANGQLDPATGTVTGNLSLTGGGDPAFNTLDLPFLQAGRTGTPQTLADLADQLAARGLHRIAGDIVGDDTLFAREPPPPGWADEDLVWGYGSLPSALSVGDNELRLEVAAPASGEGAPQMQLDQIAPAVQLLPQLQTVPRGSAAEVAIERLPEAPGSLRVFGTVAAGRPDVEHIAVPDPAAYAAAALRQLLLDRGIAVEGAARPLHALPMDATPFPQALNRQAACSGEAPGLPRCAPAPFAALVLASVTSAPLWQDVVFTLKTSANLHAEILLRRLALQTTHTAAASVDGVRAVRSVARQVGVPEGDLVLYDGSGLSTKDLVTPRAETQLLVWATHQPWFARWKAALPVGGVDGTLAPRFTTAPLRGQVFAKTGTLGESRALAGYVLAASGRELAFSILVDDHLPGTPADRTTMDRIVAAIAEAN